MIVFTSSEQIYTDSILDYIDPEKKLIHHRLYRQHCLKYDESIYTKDLRILGRDMKDVLIIDNAPYAFQLQLDNGYPIIPYTDSLEDNELEKLCHYLKEIENVEDIRVKNVEKFGLKYLTNLGIEQYVQYYQENPNEETKEKDNKAAQTELENLHESLMAYFFNSN